LLLWERHPAARSYSVTAFAQQKPLYTHLLVLYRKTILNGIVEFPNYWGTMRTCSNAGFTLMELLVVLAAVLILAIVLFGLALNFTCDLSGASVTAMKNRGRGIWVEVINANTEREPLGLSAVWPKNLGFDASRTSTEYFRLLMSDDPVAMSKGVHRLICGDLKPLLLGGAGISYAVSFAAFTRKNNAWQVICVSTQTPPEVPFLVSRNVEMGKQVTGVTTLKLNGKLPSINHRGFFVTCGGACIDRREEYLNRSSPASLYPIDGGPLEGMGTNMTYDVMQP
jgi:prepilin-type N-terminal cleavage/methylation domain-containing protein